MRLLLDTHVVIAMINGRFAADFPIVYRMLIDRTADATVSVASIWEIAIKSRLGKLQTDIPFSEIPAFLVSSSIVILPIHSPHVIATPEPEPSTRDPFDRLLLTQCQVEGLRLVTVDRALTSHPLAFLA
jgi:PIN domain nuclease of toxin-antitoxin system